MPLAGFHPAMQRTALKAKCYCTVRKVKLSSITLTFYKFVCLQVENGQTEEMKQNYLLSDKFIQKNV